LIKRIFDILASSIAILFFIPFFILIAIWIKLDSHGEIFFKQERVGKNNRDFSIFKFRTMKLNAESLGKITIGVRDSRITQSGYFLRKYKLDELPQLINILRGDMSIVGPRPEVREYVNLYNHLHLKVLEVRPGLTDYASLQYINENEILGKSKDPYQKYIQEIMPAKLNLNLKYIEEKGFFVDIQIIAKTILKIFK
jgi:lipopolysaccharide/colanic/teichoic acid biosynthesis glycosyltransferase